MYRVALLSAVLLTPTAAAAQSGVEPAFGNTIVSTYPDGRVAKAWLRPDGSYVGEGRRGGRSSGRWTVKGDRVCMRQSRPIPIPKTYCTALISGAVGTRWSAKAVTGETVMMSLVAGQGER
jgi:hypothetical protein